MSFLHDEEVEQPPRSTILAKIGGLLAFVAAFLAVKYVVSGAFNGSRQAWTPEKVGSELEKNPEFSELFGVIRANYPTEYQRFLERVATTARSGDRSAVERQSFEFTRQLTIDHLDDIARAPSAEIHDIARQYVGLINALSRSDVRLCSQFVMTGFAPGVRPNAEVKSILNRIGAMQFVAARSGETQPRDARTALSDRDAVQWFRAIRTRSQSAATLLADERALDAAAPDQQCAVGVAVYEATASLPTDVAANVMISLLRQSASPPPVR